MNKKKFYNMFNTILSAVTVFYGFEAFANKYESKPHQDNSPHHFYIQGGFESSNLNVIGKVAYISLNESLLIGYYYQLESTNLLRGALEFNSNWHGILSCNNDNKITITDSNMSLPKVLINGYYDVSILKVKGLYINFGSGIGIDRILKNGKNLYTGTIKLMLGAEYYLTDHFSISNQLHISSSGNGMRGFIQAFATGKLSTGMFTGFKYTF